MRYLLNVLNESVDMVTVDPSMLFEYDKTENKELWFDVVTRGLPASFDFMRKYCEEHSIEEAAVFCVKRYSSLVKRIFFYGLIQYVLEAYKTYGAIKRTLRSIVIAVTKYRKHAPYCGPEVYFSGTERTIINYLTTYIAMLSDEQKENKALETSVITGCAPIVPYVGFLKKPTPGERVVEEPDPAQLDVFKESLNEDEEKEEELMLASEAFSTNDSYRDCMKELITYMLSTDSLMARIIAYQDIFRHPIVQPRNLPRFAQMYADTIFANDHKAKLVAYQYYASCALYAWSNMELDSETLDKITAFSNVYWQPLPDDFDTLFANIMALTPSTEGALLNEMDHMDALQKFMKNPETYTNTNTDADPLQLFDLTPLMNYIYTQRRFRSNQYTRSAFMDLPNIGGYVFYREWLIIEPQTPEGHDMNYLYVPVIDDLNMSQNAVIKYWRNGKIDLLSQQEFYKEIEG